METQNNMVPNSPEGNGKMSNNASDGSQTETMPAEANQWGPLVGIAVIVVVIAAGGFYYWSQNQTMLTDTTEPAVEETQGVLDGEDAALEALNTQGTSSSYSDIETDFNATNLDSIDDNLQAAVTEADL